MSRGTVRSFGGLALAVFAVVVLVASGKGKKDKGNPEAAKQLQTAVKLLSAKQLDPAIKALEEVRKQFPADPAANKALELLRENGVGEEARATLVDRTFFREKLKITEKKMLEQEEAVLKELREKFYKGQKAYFTTARIELLFYDSQARYREKGGSITSVGQFTPKDIDYARYSCGGTIEWFPPQGMGTTHDRDVSIKRTLYHENNHYLVLVYFAEALPYFLEEGVVTFLTTRGVTESYQSFRETEREREEREARNGLNSIKKFEDFVKALDADRAFGQGGAMVGRWYSLAYAVVDMLAEGEMGGRKGSLDKVFEGLRQMAKDRLASRKGNERVKPLDARTVLETVVQDIYAAKLEDFHQAVLKRILTSYGRKRGGESRN